MENPLWRWLKSTGKVLGPDNENNVITHYLMNGGKLNLTEDYATFQELYVKYSHFKNCIVETKTDLFPFFIDFDVLTLEDFDIDVYIKSIQKIMYNIFKKYNNCLITKSNKDKLIIKDDKKYNKKGFHFHWPDIIVDKETAKNIRENIVVALTTEFGKPDIFLENWKKIIDKCVYNQNGLRLLWSDKCKKSDDVWEYEDRIYVVYKVYTDLDEDLEMTNNLKNDKLLALKFSSVRTDEKVKTKYYNLDNYDEVTEENEEQTSSSYIRISEISTEYDAIRKFFINWVEGKGYKWNQISKVLQLKDKDIYILESRSRYCGNVCRRHDNNHIYFKLTRDGICQKCHSESEGTHGCCRNYSSKFIKPSLGLQSSLGWKTPTNQLPSITDYSIEGIKCMLRADLTNQPDITGPPKSRKKNNNQ